MAYSPISFCVPQWHVNGVPASGYVLKAYIAGTSTLLQMATAADGLTLVNTITLNSQGYPSVSGNVVIPHLNAAYKLALYPSQAAADANSGAVWNPDRVTPSSIIANISISGNTISSTNTNGDITIDPNGSGEINLNGPTNVTDLRLSGTAITASASELNILDGVTATSAELNKIDDSAAAISNYVSGIRLYLHSDGSNSTSFSASANVTEGAFESVGPTGSSATNIWTAMNDMPSSARIAILTIQISWDPVAADDVAGVVFYARATGSSGPLGSQTRFGGIDVTPDDDVSGNVSDYYTTVMVPLDTSRRFDFSWVSYNASSVAVGLYLRGFVG